MDPESRGSEPLTCGLRVTRSTTEPKKNLEVLSVVDDVVQVRFLDIECK